MEDASHDESWKLWFQLHGPKLLLCARQWTRSLADAEDVVQEAFVRFWRHQRHLPGEPMALLVTSVRRAAFDLSRRETRRAAREEWAQGGLEENVPVFRTQLEHDDRREAIEAALRQLPAHVRSNRHGTRGIAQHRGVALSLRARRAPETTNFRRLPWTTNLNNSKPS